MVALSERSEGTDQDINRSPKLDVFQEAPEYQLKTSEMGIGLTRI